MFDVGAFKCSLMFPGMIIGHEEDMKHNDGRRSEMPSNPTS